MKTWQVHITANHLFPKRKGVGCRETDAKHLFNLEGCLVVGKNPSTHPPKTAIRCLKYTINKQTNRYINGDGSQGAKKKNKSNLITNKLKL